MDRIIYFDGVCNLCNWSVQFLIKHDKKKIFSFSSLQSDIAKSRLKKVSVKLITTDSVVYEDAGSFYTRSDAFLKIIDALGGGWRLFNVVKLIPRPWRDWVYDFIANHRYKWFGRKDTCMIPTKEIKDRFLD